MKLDIGKIPNEHLRELLKNYTGLKRTEVLSCPMVGEDCAAVDFSDDICAVTTDPITGADDELGTLGVHVACNDLASSGAEPVGLMITILAPAGTTLEQVDSLMKQIRDAAAALDAAVIGGHTEVTDAVNRMVLSVTALGRVKRDKFISTHGAKPGDAVIFTNYAGTEGTAIISRLFEKEFRHEFGEKFVESSKKLLDHISVVREGLLAAQYGVTSMHDVTEGGVLGAVREVAEAGGYGLEIEKSSIPVLEETRRICYYLSLDPLRLISSGCMLLTTPDGDKLLRIFHQQDIKASIIGRVTFGNECILVDGENRIPIEAPGTDELYKARKMKGLI